MLYIVIFKMQPKIMAKLVLGTPEHLELALFLQNWPFVRHFNFWVRAQRNLAFFSAKRGKLKKQMSYPPIWGHVNVNKWSPFLDSGAWSSIFWHLKMGNLVIDLLGTIPDQISQRVKCQFRIIKVLRILASYQQVVNMMWPRFVPQKTHALCILPWWKLSIINNDQKQRPIMLLSKGAQHCHCNALLKIHD